MASTVTARIVPSVSISQTPTTGVLSGNLLNLPLTLALNLAAGTGGSDVINRVYYGVLTFVTSTPQTLDLQSLTDVLGEAVVFAKVRAIAIQNLSTAGATLTVGNSVTNEWDAILSATGTVTVGGATAANPNGGFWLQANPTGWVVDATHKTLKLDPGAAAFTINIVVVGSTT